MTTVSSENANRESAVRLNRDAVQAMANRRPAEARHYLQQALQLDPLMLPAWMNMAVARRMEGDFTGALDAVDEARKLDPLCFAALLMRGSLLEAMGKPYAAARAYNVALTQMPPDDRLDPATRKAVAHALDIHAGYGRDMDSYLHQSLSTTPPSGSSAPARRMSGFVDHMLGKKRVYHSQPTNLFYPGLPSIEVYDRDEFPWLPEVEAATPSIQAELAAVFDDEVAVSDIEPYTQRDDGEPLEQWGELNKSMRWSAYHFAFYGKPYPEHQRKCPFTADLLTRLPQPHIANRSPASMFSILQPKTHIPPHNGVANFRLLCHLPLILPPSCRFRVGNITREWRIGEAFVFDDTIEHEAWNDSDQMRTVMIFDIWHPALNDDERDFIKRSMAALDRFNEME